MDALSSTDAEPVLSLTKQFIAVLRDTVAVLTPMSSISQYFARLGIDYYKIASIACDSKVTRQQRRRQSLFPTVRAITIQIISSRGSWPEMYALINSDHLFLQAYTP